MLQDIAPYQLNNEFLTQAGLPVDGASLLLIREKNGIFCRIREGQLELPGAAQLQGSCELRYLIAVDGCRFYMPVRSEYSAAGEHTAREVPQLGGTQQNAASEQLKQRLTEEGFSLHTVRELRYAMPAWLRFGALTAWQAAGWYQNNVYCGRCAAELRPGEKERSLVCPSCGLTIYPKLCPVVITGVIYGEQILLTKYAAGGSYSKFALVAGFAEIGETIEETVAREVMEETGLRVKNLHYYKSQPWAYSESLLFGFFCEAEIPAEIRVDPKELSLAVWTGREEIPDYPDEISLTYEMMQQFREKGRGVLQGL